MADDLVITPDTAVPAVAIAVDPKVGVSVTPATATAAKLVAVLPKIGVGVRPATATAAKFIAVLPRIGVGVRPIDTPIGIFSAEAPYAVEEFVDFKGYTVPQLETDVDFWAFIKDEATGKQHDQGSILPRA